MWRVVLQIIVIAITAAIEVERVLRKNRTN
jgi:hypothetical protein